MSQPKDPYTFTNATVVSDNYALVGAMFDDLAEENTDHGIVFKRMNGEWQSMTYPGAICGSWLLMKPAPIIVSVGTNGTVYNFDADGQTTEDIDVSDEGPSDLLTLRNGRIIDGKIYAVGMARHVYVREGKGDWTAIDAGVFVPRDEIEDAIGFLAVDGRSSSDIYAVGYAGEIWHYDGRQWAMQDSPTNLALTDLCITEEGLVHIVGQLGLYIVGSRGSWSVVDHGLHEDDFWGCEVFKGKVYCSTNRGVFRYDDGLAPVDVGGDAETTFALMEGSSEVLWSVGAKDIFETRDGGDWERVPPA